MPQLETIKVVSDNAAGYVIINKDDFDAGQHEEFTGVKKVVEQSQAKESTCYTFDELAKMKRAELEALAKEKGLDGNAYTNKTELANAILKA